MLSCMEPIIRQDINTKDVTVYVIGDVHYGDPLCDRKGFTAVLDKIRDDPQARVILVGDLLNNATKNSKSDVYTALIPPMTQKIEMTNLLEPIKDKILCGCSGNHENRTTRESNQDVMYDIFAKLDIEDRYRNEMCFLLVRLGEKGQHVDSKCRPAYTFCVTHGKGNSIYTGSSANAAERFASRIEGVDLFVTGHTHKPLSFPVGKLVFDARNKQIRTAQFRVVTAASWLGYGGYAAEKMLAPVARVCTTIKLSARHKHFSVEM